MAASVSLKRKPPNWLDRLTATQRDEIEDIKRAWLAGELQASCLSLAISLVDNCRASGIPICGVAGVRAWLGKV